MLCVKKSKFTYEMNLEIVLQDLAIARNRILRKSNCEEPVYVLTYRVVELKIFVHQLQCVDIALNWEKRFEIDLLDRVLQQLVDSLLKNVKCKFQIVSLQQMKKLFNSGQNVST